MNLPAYIAAYDTETPRCLEAVKAIVRLHERFEMPATFFLVAQLLEEQGGEYRSLLGDHPLFEIASHSYTHMLLRPHPAGAAAGPPEAYPREIVSSKQRLEEHFGRRVHGFRTPWGYCDGLRGCGDLLGLCDQAGYRYVSSLLWGPHTTMPALLERPFTYAAEGYPDLWELPGCGWHDNVLKEVPRIAVTQLYPHPLPAAMRAGPIESPRQEFEICRAFLDHACATSAAHVSFIWHPWSLGGFDPRMHMIELVFGHVRERGLKAVTFGELSAAMAQGGAPVPGHAGPPVA